jgi:hypothetical protein
MSPSRTSSETGLMKNELKLLVPFEDLLTDRAGNIN